MKLFEFEAKNILRQYGIATPKGDVARNAADAGRIADELARPVALKSQVLVSGRGKAGGILFAEGVAAVQQAALKLFGSDIKGNRVTALLVEEKVNITSEFYAAVIVDRNSRRYLALASASGGIDIEEVALASPERIARHVIDPAAGFDAPRAEAMTGRLAGIENSDARALAETLVRLYRAATDNDAELVETNPLVKTASGGFVACDARIIIDDNALFRHPEFAQREVTEAENTPREIEAQRQNMAYVDLDGDIGIVGNGAGLVMATVDLVQYFGGRPANFLDLGGGSSAEIIKQGLLLVMSKPEVRSIVINILGGITRCDIVAQGVVEALKEAKAKKPVAIRMMGTNEEAGAIMLRQAGVPCCATMEEAVQQAVSAR